MRAKANWKLIVESVPSGELVRKLISAVLSDSQLPVKMDRFDPSIGRTLYAHAMNNNAEIEMLANLGFPEHLSHCEPPNKHTPALFGAQVQLNIAAAASRIKEEAKDAVLEHVFMPLVERSFWSGLPGLDLQESPESRARRNHLLAQEAALVRLIDGLTQFRDGQGFHPNAEPPAGDSGSPAGAAAAAAPVFGGAAPAAAPSSGGGGWHFPGAAPAAAPSSSGGGWHFPGAAPAAAPSSGSFGGAAPAAAPSSGSFGGAAPAPPGFNGATPSGGAAAAPSSIGR